MKDVYLPEIPKSSLDVRGFMFNRAQSGQEIPKLFALDAREHLLAINEHYRALLVSLGYDVSNVLRYELHGYRRHECVASECGQQICVPIATVGKLHPYQSTRHVNRVLSRVLQRVDFVKDKFDARYLLDIVLTFPDEAPALSRREVGGMFAEFQKKFSKLLGHGGAKLGGFYNYHTWSSSRPVEEHRHIHSKFFNVAVYNDETPVSFSAMPPANKVKKLWLKVLKKHGCWPSRYGPDELPVVHLNYGSLRDMPKLIHMISYGARKPIVDLNTNLTADMIAGEVSSFATSLINYNNRTVMFGYMCSLRKLGCVCSKRVNLPCPICGQPMLKREVVYDCMPTIPHYCVIKGQYVPVGPPTTPISGVIPEEVYRAVSPKKRAGVSY